MAVSLDGVNPNSNIYRFITSGKKGLCSLCRSRVEKLEAHHISYSPEITIKLCHLCHHKVHFWPTRLSDEEKIKLLQKRFTPAQSLEILNQKLWPDAMAKLIAPSRSVFVHQMQSREKQKLYKEAMLKKSG